MKKAAFGFFSALIIVALSGCGGGNSTPGTNNNSAAPSAGNTSGQSEDFDAERDRHHKKQESATPAMAAETSPALGSEAKPAPAPAAETPAATPATETPAAPASGGLVGTKWDYKGIALEFKEGNKVFLKGGPVESLAPDGTEADYTLTDNAIEVNVFGQVYSGTWDGTKLIIDGTEATAAQ